MIEIEDLKKQILLHGMEDKEYAKLASVLEYRSYKKDERLFSEGDSSEGIFMIKKGRVKISKAIAGGRRRTIVIFRDGNYFGDLSALEKRPHSASAIALTDVEVFLLRCLEFECLMKDDLVLLVKILRKLCLIASKNLRQMNEKFLRLGESF